MGECWNGPPASLALAHLIPYVEEPRARSLGQIWGSRPDHPQRRAFVPRRIRAESRLSKGRLTRNELSWLLTQEAQNAAERLRVGVQFLRTQAPPPPSTHEDPAVGVDWKKLLHGEQGFVLHRPIPAQGEVIGRSRIVEIVDKGKDRGALAFIERTITDAATGETIATLNSTSFLRGDGGFGGPTGPTPAPHKLPERAPDNVCDLATLPQQALIYRLSGDYNPLHADPEVATHAGFKQPILHGLCSLGVAGHAILKVACGYDPARLRSLKLRFSSPVYPGETIRTEMWIDGKDVSFRARVVERDIVVLDNGLATLR